MDINKLLEQAQAMQKKMEQEDREIRQSRYKGTASNGLVTVEIDGNNIVTDIEIADEIVNIEDKDMLVDMLKIAFNNATNELTNRRNESITRMTGGMKIPGL